MKGRAQWLNPDLVARWDATRASAVEGADAAIPVWIAAECNRALCGELTEEEEKLHGRYGECGRGTELLNAWKKFEVFRPLKGRAPSEPLFNSRWSLLGKRLI